MLGISRSYVSRIETKAIDKLSKEFERQGYDLRIGLCLSGGGIKGAAHIGVLKALEEKHVKIDCISGASSGSIVAALYAIGYTPDEIYSIFKEYASKIKYDGMLLTYEEFHFTAKMAPYLFYKGIICCFDKDQNTNYALMQSLDKIKPFGYACLLLCNETKVKF